MIIDRIAMCGILFCDLDAVDGGADAVRASGALSSLTHRGPEAHAELVVFADGSGKGHLLSFDRLAIVSCTPTGMQPFTSAMSSSTRHPASMVCSGEIYNHEDLGAAADLRSDCEAVLRMLEDKLDDASPEDIAQLVGKLDGDFAFVVTDGTHVVAGRDPYGVRPLFYAERVGGGRRIVAFASEAKALVRLTDVTVHVFPPGLVCLGSRSSATWAPTWAPTWPPPQGPTSSSTSPKEAVLRRLTEAVRKRIEHAEQDEVAVLCSGGIDSAAITCIAASLASKERRVRVFTMKYRSGHSDDAFYAGLLCRALGVAHETLEFGPDDITPETIDAVVLACETKDPNTVRAAIPMFLMARRIRELAPGVKVVLSGEGADELFGGYGYFRFAPSPVEASLECERLLRNLHMFDLLRADRCFAAHGLEVRVPFLDADLVRCVSALPGGDRVAGEKQLLRDAVAHFPELARCRVLDRPKEKFSDGAGFSYVPDLLRRLAVDQGGQDDGVLSTRLRTEAAHYAAAFERHYGRGCGSDAWVVERALPKWAGLAEARSAGESGGGLVNV